MTKEPIKNFFGQTIGYVETDERTGDQVVRDFYNKILGYYYKDRNVTTDFYKRIVARGNALTSFLAAEFNRRK